jgi:hypothetical protein
MKRFLRKIFLFSLPVLIGLGIIFFIKTDREFCYNYVKGDCDQRGKLLYKKIYEDPNKVDYLFVGSSKTWNDINDELLEELIASPGSYHYKLFNVGYCRFGRNLDYLFCKEFLKRNRLKKIFLEVRADESTTSHPIFPFLANGKEVLEGALALNGSLFPDVYDHLLMNINYTRCLLKLERAEKNMTNPFRHGYNNIDKTIPADKLDEFYAKELKELQPVNTSAISYRFSNYYLKKIKQLCDKKNIELVFVYLPSYGNISKAPAFKSDYEKMGKVIIGPDSIFRNKMYYKDVAHFNSRGAEAFTRFLATAIKH